MKEFFAVPIDVLDAHRGDDLAELAENNVSRLLFDLRRVQPQEADGGVIHDFQVGADRHGKNAGDIDPDVLDRQGILERDLDLDRFQAQEGMVLKERPDKGRAAVDAASGISAPHLTEDHQHAVARAALVAADDHHEKADRDQRHKDWQDDPPNILDSGLGKKNGVV